MARRYSALLGNLLMPENIEKAIKEWAHWYHKNELLVERGDKPSDSEIDFEVEA